MITLRQRCKSNYTPPVDAIGEIQSMITLKDGHLHKIRKFAPIFETLDTDNIQEIWAVHGEFFKSQLHLVLPFIRQWKLTKLYLWSNKSAQLLREIQQIQFTNLRQLHLGRNKIQSIEGLSFLKMPKLKQLVLSDNKINSVVTLRKCQLPDLKVLCLRGNLIREFTLQYWSFPSLKQLNCNDNLLVSVAPTLKMAGNGLTLLRARPILKFSQRRSELEDKLRNRFSRIKQVGL